MPKQRAVILCLRRSTQPRVPHLKTIQRKHGKVKLGLRPPLQKKIIFLLGLFDVTFPPLPCFPLSSITSLLPYAGVDNSGLPSLSQEPLPCPEAVLLQAAPPRSSWIWRWFWGQQFFPGCLPSFSHLLFTSSHSLPVLPILLPLCPWCPQRLLPPALAFPIFPGGGAACWSRTGGPCDYHPGLLAPHFYTVTQGPEAQWLSLSWMFGSWSAHRRLGGVACLLQCLKYVGLTAQSGRAGDGFQMQGAGETHSGNWGVINSVVTNSTTWFLV